MTIWKHTLLLLMMTAGTINAWGQTEITSLSNITASDGNYIITADISGGSPGVASFSGTLEAAIDPDTHMPYKITGLSAPLFTTLTGTVKNLVLENVNISGHTGNTGAIAGTASDTARVYNVGILSGSVGGTGNTGGLVGQLDGTARVINCYSYATITDGTTRAGIVGSNNKESKQGSITTMVMNCMFYGDIADGNNISPIYGGTEIANASGGLPNYNFYRYRSSYSINKKITKYNCALAMEEKFINRFERYRLLLNSNKKLAAWYATGNASDTAKIAKWVLETADRTIATPKPYPILKVQGKYPSIINYDADHAPDSATVGRYKGGKVGTPLNVTISDVGDNSPASNGGSAIITRSSLTLIRTDKDEDRFNFNYDKVQLPYYNDVGTGNYTKNRVVTGWEITGFTGGTEGTYNPNDTWGGYNFADRHCTNKDKYGTNGSNRIFSQGAYFDVPNGVTGITIRPHWATAAYVSDQLYDVAFAKDYKSTDPVEEMGSISSGDGKEISINGDSQKVWYSIGTAYSKLPTAATVYDNAIVLVGNVHQYANPTNNTTPYTLMSIDLNHDNEPDCTYIFGHSDRQAISPIRYDFLNIVGIAEAQKPKGASLFRNVSLVRPKGWFEITNTCVVHFSEFEYDTGGKSKAPLILLGGTYQQFVSTQNTDLGKTTQYIHVGGNAWFAKFGNGTHSDGNKFTPHIPISVTGGDYDEFYLSGTYQPNIGSDMEPDNAECYVSGGRFGEMAGASLEPIYGNVQWDIDQADIKNFYGGGVNANNPITGNIIVNITRSHVERYCGGPKFGDMSDDMKVETNATDCTFDKFFGAGFGGNSYNRVKYYDVQNAVPQSYQNHYTNDRGKYYDGKTTNAPGNANYGKKGKGVATDFDYEFFVWANGVKGARFYVQFASFSLAITNDVTSTLTGCTINEDFYGGGNLGKVKGTATSVLDNCTVNGNVFGGGFSAEIPKIPVRNTPAFVSGKEPSINSEIGMFEMGEIADSVEYEWKHVDKMPNNGNPGTEEDKYVYTDQDLTTLGQVATVNLTVKGNSYVQGKVVDGKNTGGVFGGGDMSAVNGNTTVLIQTTGERTIQNVYGGGNNAPVGGNTVVTLKDGEIDGNVYGGGNNGEVSGSTTVNIIEE